jgi:hypothetical protein
VAILDELEHPNAGTVRAKIDGLHPAPSDRSPAVRFVEAVTRDGVRLPGGVPGEPPHGAAPLSGPAPPVPVRRRSR